MQGFSAYLLSGNDSFGLKKITFAEFYPRNQPDILIYFSQVINFVKNIIHLNY